MILNPKEHGLSKNLVQDIKETILPNKDLRTIFFLTAAWLVLMLAGIFVQGFAALDAAWLAGIVVDLLLAAGIALSLKFYLLGDTVKGYRGYKAFVGYGVFFTYVAQAIASYSWSETLAEKVPLISGPRSLFGWAYAVVATVPALALYILVSSNAWRVKLGLMTQKDVKAKVRYKTPKPKTLPGKVLDNVDAIVQAVIMVAVIHAVLFQLYVIPTESMVPKFLINDRVIVTKAQSGPRVPLSPIKLPSLTEPKRGDIIVYDNPFSPKPNALRRMANTVAFYLSFSLLKLDVDEIGNPRVGTVVKRLIGMPGDKLMMVDDVLYRKTKDSPDWSVMREDALWSHTDLYKESPKIAGKIQRKVMSETIRKEFNEIDALKKGKSLAEFTASLEQARKPFEALSSARLLSALSDEGKAYLKDSERGSWGSFDSDVRANGLSSLYAARSLAMRDDVGLFLYAVSDQSRIEALNEFFTSPEYPKGMNAYNESAAKLNAYAKSIQAERWGFYLNLVSKGDIKALSRISGTQNDEGPAAIDVLEGQGQVFRKWGILYYYMNYDDMYDMRNFPEFPAGNEYIPEGQYFLMGDNRYNSLDFRFNHDYHFDTVSLDPFDPQSVKRQSNISMSTLDKKNILGKVLLTIWPLGASGR
jgi:signal peptidase I